MSTFQIATLCLMANAREIDENSIDADFNIMYSRETIINYDKQTRYENIVAHLA